jgi:hypothetical protein
MKSCFGTIDPDLEQFQFGKPMPGEVFQITINTVGTGNRDRKLDIDGTPGNFAGNARTSRIASTSQTQSSRCSAC